MSGIGLGGRTIIDGDWTGYGETRHDKNEEIRQLHVERRLEVDDFVHCHEISVGG